MNLPVKIFIILALIALYGRLGDVHAAEMDLTTQFHKESSWISPENLAIGLSTTAIIADWATTRDATRMWDTCNCKETNRWLGEYPTTQEVDRYFLTYIPLHWALNWWLRTSSPAPWKRTWLYSENTSIFVMHGRAAYKNHTDLGWSYRF